MKKLVSFLLLAFACVMLLSSCNRGFGKSDPCNYGFQKQELPEMDIVFIDTHC